MSTLKRYQITWCLYPDIRCDVSMLLEPAMVEAAIRGGGVKETPKKLQLCEMVRETALQTHPQLRLQPVFFGDLVITPLS